MDICHGGIGLVPVFIFYMYRVYAIFGSYTRSTCMYFKSNPPFGVYSVYHRVQHGILSNKVPLFITPGNRVEPTIPISRHIGVRVRAFRLSLRIGWTRLKRLFEKCLTHRITLPRHASQSSGQSEFSRSNQWHKYFQEKKSEWKQKSSITGLRWSMCKICEPLTVWASEPIYHMIWLGLIETAMPVEMVISSHQDRYPVWQ